MIRLFYYDNTWINVDNDIDAQKLVDDGATEYTAEQIRGVAGNEHLVDDDTMFQDENGWYFQLPQTDIPTLKEQKHIELRNQRDYLRQTEFAEFDNDTFRIRQEDQDNMNTFYADAIAMLSGVVDRESFGIMSATNTLHTFTPEQIVQLAKLMKAKVEEIYTRYWYARDILLENATTASEIQAITIPSALSSN